jgi:predicted nucleic acid-binding Zn ribbon protein
MPVYVYKNLQTGEMFEWQQSIREPALTAHPDTGAPVKRVVQPVGIAFKGSGFYVTDSRKSSSNAQSNGKASKEGDKSGTPAKGEGGASSPASKAEGKQEAKTGASPKKD